MGPSWDVTRMVNYHHGLARMTLTPQAGGEPDQLRGAVFVQSFTLADGSLCLKASLNWQGSEVFPIISVYSKPGVDWKAEARQIGSAWLAGPPNGNVTRADTAVDEDEIAKLLAVAS